MKSFTLGSIQIDSPVFLAPMSGISDMPFRKLVKSFGAGLVFSEMIASRAMIDHHKDTLKMSSNCAEEFPMVVQLAGCDPYIMAEAAKMNVDRGAAIIDINFGCPVKKIVNKYAGSALMQDEDLATDIMAEVVKAVNVPVTMKTRLGWNAENLNAPSLAKKAEDVGIQMITIHGRTRQQMYNGHADWEAIAKVREAITLPLIANGDINDFCDATEALEQSGADGVMIGRGCCGKPWFLSQVMAYLRGDPIPQDPTIAQQLEIILCHYNDILEYYGERKGVSLARKHLSWYISEQKNAAKLRGTINTLKTPEEVIQALEDFYDPLIEEQEKALAA
jgi:tRNA-dihydrouridine synthase B